MNPNLFSLLKRTRNEKIERIFTIISITISSLKISLYWNVKTFSKFAFTWYLFSTLKQFLLGLDFSFCDMTLWGKI